MAPGYATLDVADAASKVRREVFAHGVCTMEGFLGPDALRDAVREAASKADAAFVSTKSHNVYLLPEKDARLPPQHIRNREFPTTVASIACDELSDVGALKKLYFGQVGDWLLQVLTRVFGKQMYRIEDPLGCVSVNVFKKGWNHGWHFDESEVTVTLSLQKAAVGGEFVFSPLLRERADDFAVEKVEKIVQGECDVQTLSFEPGTLSIFAGSRSLHRVNQISDGLRLVAVFCFSSTRGVRNSAAVQEQFWGRSVL